MTDHRVEFLSLPPELRQQIYSHIFSPSPTYYILWPNDTDPAKIVYGKFNHSVMFTCRTVYEEAFPVFCSQMILHVNYNSLMDQPRLPDIQKYLPEHVRQHTRRIVLHVNVSPRKPSPEPPSAFHLFLSLRRFVVRVFQSNETLRKMPGPTSSEADWKEHHEYFNKSRSDSGWQQYWIERPKLPERNARTKTLHYCSKTGWLAALLRVGVSGGSDDVSKELQVPEGCEVQAETVIVLTAHEVLEGKDYFYMRPVTGFVRNEVVEDESRGESRYLNEEEAEQYSWPFRKYKQYVGRPQREGGWTMTTTSSLDCHSCDGRMIRTELPRPEFSMI